MDEGGPGGVALHEVLIPLLCVHIRPGQGLGQAPHPSSAPSPPAGGRRDCGCRSLAFFHPPFIHLPGWGPCFLFLSGSHFFQKMLERLRRAGQAGRAV